MLQDTFLYLLLKGSHICDVSRSYLERWYDDTIQYLCRCVRRLGQDIVYIIHAVSMHCKGYS